MGFLSKLRAPTKWVAIFNQGLYQIEIKKLTAKTENVVEDSFLKKGYEIGPDIKYLQVKFKNKILGRYPLIDEARGVGVNLEPDAQLINVRTNPVLLGQMIDAVLITMAYSLNPSNKKIIIVGIVLFLLGLLFGRGMA